jgi:hypothetical protein
LFKVSSPSAIGSPASAGVDAGATTGRRLR